MRELRLMNKEYIDSVIRTDRGVKYLVINGECVCRAPISFDFKKYEESYARGIISGLREHLWKHDVNGALVFMDDLNDEMIQPLVYQIAYEHAKQVVEDFNDEVYQCDMRECGERIIELGVVDKRFMDCIEYYESDELVVCKWLRNKL